VSGLAKYFAALSFVTAVFGVIAAISSFSRHALREGIVEVVVTVVFFALGLAAWIYRHRLE
jgi:hypothetical protein